MARRVILILLHLLFAGLHMVIQLCVCVCGCSLCHFEAATGKMSLRSALDQIKQSCLWDYVCVNTKTVQVYVIKRCDK